MKRPCKAGGTLPEFLFIPSVLLKTRLSPSELYIYGLLLQRAFDAEAAAPAGTPAEEIFVCFPVRELAELMDLSGSTVKLALKALEKQALISRQKQGGGRPDRIFVKWIAPKEGFPPRAAARQA